MLWISLICNCGLFSKGEKKLFLDPLKASVKYILYRCKVPSLVSDIKGKAVSIK